VFTYRPVPNGPVSWGFFSGFLSVLPVPTVAVTGHTGQLGSKAVAGRSHAVLGKTAAGECPASSQPVLSCGTTLDPPTSAPANVNFLLYDPRPSRKRCQQATEHPQGVARLAPVGRCLRGGDLAFRAFGLRPVAGGGPPVLVVDRRIVRMPNGFQVARHGHRRLARLARLKTSQKDVSPHRHLGHVAIDQASRRIDNRADHG
jgi:hypothetical protein